LLLVRATKSHQIERVQFVATLSPGQNSVRHCRRNRQLGDNVAGFGDIVAGVDGAYGRQNLRSQAKAFMLSSDRLKLQKWTMTG